MSATANEFPTDPAGQFGAPHRLPVKTLIAASAGNAVEWYDWSVYATFAIYFSTQVFPPGNDTLALINTFATYALSFFFRPLGGLLLGRFADTRGRRAAMLLSLTMMAFGSLVIALCPTYAQVGWFSPVILLFARILQGISLGGEVSHSSAYLGEIAPPERRGRYSAFFYISTGSSVLVASLIGAFLSGWLAKDALNSWGWRIPFVVGALIGLVGLWLRRDLAESQHFEANQAAALKVKNPLLATLRDHPKQVAQIVGFTLLSTLCYYTFFSAITPYAVKTVKIDANLVFWALSIATVCFILVQYPFGALSDRFGRKPQMLLWAALIALGIVPLSKLIAPDATLLTMTFVFAAGLVCYSLLSSIAPAVMSELFPTKLRALGIGAWYNLTVALFGGTAPLVITWLSDAHHPDWFFIYVAIAAVICFCTVLTLRETKGIELE